MQTLPYTYVAQSYTYVAHTQPYTYVAHTQPYTYVAQSQTLGACHSAAKCRAVTQRTQRLACNTALSLTALGA